MDTYDDAARARIRAVLKNYAKENTLSVDDLYEALCKAERRTRETIGFTFRTFQRFMAGSHETGKKTVAVCARVAEGLPRRPTVFHALGERLYALYQTPLPPDLAPSYNLVSGDNRTVISISAAAEGFALVTERHLGRFHRIFDGVLVSLYPRGFLIILKDRNLKTPRQIMTSNQVAAIYEYCLPLHPGCSNWHCEGEFTHA
ncbi:MAG TPA: hypothetical protein VJX73_04610 [Terracidiphilus sp.]|nr:hypothetical protein [Terracidiphilus sp.]